MITNRYPGKCQSCGNKLAAGEGFAYKNGHKWFSACNSTACHARLGLKAPEPESKKVRKITEDGFIFMPYDRDAVPFLSSLPGARWNPDKPNPYGSKPGAWSFSTKGQDLPRVLEICEKLELEIPEKFKVIVAAGTTESREAEIRANKTYGNKKLYDYQKVGVKFLALRERALLADDMGLGKCLQSLLALPANSSCIIVCPSSLKYNWMDEINIWRPNEFKVHICEGKNNLIIPGPNEISIINYDILPDYLSTEAPEDIADALKKVVVISDEVQRAKNYKAKRSVKLRALNKAAARAWLLTGTPLMNSPTDLYGVLQAGNMDALGSWNKFVSLFNGFKNQFGGYEFGMPKPEVAERLKRVTLRRLKSDVLKELPPKTYKTILVDSVGKELNAELKAFTTRQLEYEGNDGQDANDLDLVKLPNFSEFSTIRAKLAESRIPAMFDIVDSYEEQETPLLVFSSHRKPILELEKREGWACIYGDMPSEDRRNIVRKFQAGELKGVGLTITAGGEGLTLTRASNVLFVDMDWTPALNIQAEDRAHRISQKDNVLIMRMVSNHVLDLHIHKLLEYKIKLAHEALESSLNFKPIKARPLVQDIKLVEETEEELRQRILDAEVEGNRKFYLEKLQAIAAREAAKVSDIPEPELNPGRKAMLRQALEYMAARCDGAHNKDGIGFNKADTGIRHWIDGTQLRDADDMVFRVLERILVRYRRQLKGNFEAIWKPDL